jgi:hypothetical protein
VNIAATSKVQRVLFDIMTSSLLSTSPEVGLLDQMAVLFLVFKGISILSSIVAILIYNPQTAVLFLVFKGISILSSIVAILIYNPQTVCEYPFLCILICYFLTF